MQKLYVRYVFLLLVVSVAACGGGLTPSNADLSGNWSGTASSQADTTLSVTVILMLNETGDGSISGNGVFSIQIQERVRGKFSVSVASGTHSGHRFSIVLDPETNREDITYSGTVEVVEGAGSAGPDQQARLNGRLDGGGFDGFQILLTR